MKSAVVSGENRSTTGMAEKPLGATASVAVSLLLIAIMAAFFAFCSNYCKAGDEAVVSKSSSENAPIGLLELTNIDGILCPKAYSRPASIQNSSPTTPMTTRARTTKLTGKCSAR